MDQKYRLCLIQDEIQKVGKESPYCTARVCPSGEEANSN